MTALFALDRLLAHAAPFDPCLAHGTAPTRAALHARWQIGADGRLACRWLADGAAPDFPPD